MPRLTRIKFFPRLLGALLVFSIGFFSFIASAADREEKMSDILELRGYTRIGGVLEFSVYNKSEKRSRWLKVNEEYEGYKIEKYDGKRNEIVIQFDGRKGRLPLQASQLAEYKPQPPAPAPAPAAAATDQAGSNNTARPASRGNGRRGRNQTPGSTGESDSTLGRGGDGTTGGWVGSGRNRGGPPTPPDPGNDGNDGDSGGNNDDSDSEPPPSWDSVGDPPPVPVLPPPSYTPRDNTD